MTQETVLLSVLKEQIRVVAQTRDKASRLKRQKDILLEAWNANNRELLDDLTQAGANVAVEEQALRELTLQAYAETGSKSPAEGVGIREITTYSYDDLEALKWAMEHRVALKLDGKAFEAVAKSQAKTNPIPFVTIGTEPQATIATNLPVED